MSSAKIYGKMKYYVDIYEVRLLKNVTDVVSAILTNEIGVLQFLGHNIYARTNNQCTT